MGTPRGVRRPVGLSRWLAPALFLVACAAPPPAADQAPAADADRWEPEIRSFEAADRERRPEPGGAVFVGSSSIRLWSTLARDFPEAGIVNRGFGGSELSDVVRYADRLILPHRPALVMVYGGDNDIANGKTPERVLADFQALVRGVHRELPDTRLGFISIKPSPARWHLRETVQRANALIRDFAARDPRLLYVDVHTPMLGPGGLPRDELYVQDRLHMTPAGYEIWKSAIAPYLVPKRR